MTILPNHGAAGTGSRLRPYLTTAQLISLCVLAAPLVSLIFVLFRLQASSDVAQQSVTQAKATLQASCLAAEHAATVGASLPRYLAQGVNDEITKSVRATMNGVRIGLTLSLTAVEALIEFIIDMYRSTFLCLLELVIRGGLAVVISAVSEITSFINTTLSSISSSIAGDVSTANSVIQTAVNLVKKIPLVGDNINIPQFTVPSAAQLSSIQIPTTFEDSLRTLNSSIPTLDELRQQLDNLISVPFQLLTKEINDTFAAAEANFTLTPLPVPQQATVSFCDDTLSSSFDNLARDLLKVAEIGFFIIIGCMVLVFFAYAFLTWYSQRSLRQNIERIRHLWFGDGTATTDRLMAFDALISHPIWSRIVKFLAEKFRISQEKYDALTWFGLYVFHPAPLACLLIGIFGILSVQLQLLIIRPLQEHYSTEVANNIQDLTGTIATKLNSTMWEESGAYAVALNEKISGVQTAINTDLFGWVNATIVPLNNTLASFYQEVQDTVNTLLGGTPFDSPAQEFIRCILGSKVVGIEHALTFLQQNLQVDLPQVNTSALVLSQANVNEVATPISAAAVGSSDNGQDGGVIGKIIGAYISSLEKERITFFLFLLLWALAVFVALLVIAWHFWVVPALHKRGMKEPRWLAGPSWEDSMVYKSDPSQVEKYQLHNLKAGDAAMVSPIPSPLRKNADAASTSHTMVGDSDSLRQRRPGENKASGDMSSFLPGDEQPRPSLFAKIGGFISKRRGNHTAKRSSDSSILPIAKNVEPEPKAAEEEPSYEWFERLTFWKRGVVPAEEDVLTPPRGVTIPHDRTASQDSGFDYDVPPPRHPATRPRSNEGRPRPDLRVDVAKATATSNQPRIVIENPGYSIEPTVVIAPSRPKAPSRQGSEGSNRDYLAVPSRSQPKRVHEPKPPAWVAAIKNKQGLPATPGESPDRSSPPTRPRENQGSRPSRSNSLPKRPPGLPMKTEERGRQPSVPKPAVTVDSHDRSRHEKKRRSSVPPGASRNRTDSSQGQQCNKSLTRSSSLDDVDPFATPRSMVKPLPLPLEPVKLAPPANQASTSTAHIVPSIMVTKPSVSSINPFITPFDDSYAVYTKGTGAGAPTNGAGYNFSMPNRRQDGAI